MKTRRREPPGRDGEDKSRRGRDPKKSGTRSGSPVDSTRGSRRGGKPDSSSRKPGKSGSGARSGRGRDTSGGPPREPRRGERSRAAAPSLLARSGRELLFGRNAVREALRGRRGADRLFVAEGVREDDRLRGLMDLARQRGATVERVPRLLLDDATRGANHQGVALEAETYRYVPFEDLLETPGTVLVLDHLQDPQNVGTLLRAAEAAGVAGVVLPEDRAASVTPAVVNASAGAVEHLRIAAVPNLARAVDALKHGGWWVAGLDSGPGASDLFRTEIPTPAAILVGAEGTGIGANLRKHCDLLLSLPMYGRVESLNAATAGAIALYELLRREETARAPDPGDGHEFVGQPSDA